MTSNLPPNQITPIYNSNNFQKLKQNIVDFSTTFFVPRSGGTFSGRINFTDDFWIVSDVSQLPTPASGIISIPTGVTLYIVNNLDLEGNRILALGNITIIGNSSETSSLFSTGLPTSSSLITSSFTLPIRFITLGCPSDTSVFNLTGDGTNGLDLAAVNFGSTSLVCGSVGSISNYTNVIFSDCAFLNYESGLEMSGTIGTIGISNTLFIPMNSNSTMINLQNLTITRRFRVIYSSLVVGTNQVGIKVINTTIPDESFILGIVNFSGDGMYLDGILPSSNKSLITDTIGLLNSNKLGFITMSGNETTTLISSTGLYIKAAGTTLLNSVSQKFVMPVSNRIQYTGAILETFKISITCTITSGNNNTILLGMFKNGVVLSGFGVQVTTDGGGRVESVSFQGISLLETDDYLELFVQNVNNVTNIVVVDLSIIVNGV